MSVFKITKAYLNSNVVYFEVPAAADWEVGEIVTVAGCITGAFNASLTVATAGLLNIPVAASSGAGTSLLWSGFTAALTNANVAVEIESGATVTNLN